MCDFCSYLLLGTHQLPLQAFEGALKFTGEEDVDVDEVQCIVANLIDKVIVGFLHSEIIPRMCGDF